MLCVLGLKCTLVQRSRSMYPFNFSHQMAALIQTPEHNVFDMALFLAFFSKLGVENQRFVGRNNSYRTTPLSTDAPRSTSPQQKNSVDALSKRVTDRSTRNHVVDESLSENRKRRLMLAWDPLRYRAMKHQYSIVSNPPTVSQTRTTRT